MTAQPGHETGTETAERPGLLWGSYQRAFIVLQILFQYYKPGVEPVPELARVSNLQVTGRLHHDARRTTHTVIGSTYNLHCSITRRPVCIRQNVVANIRPTNSHALGKLYGMGHATVAGLALWPEALKSSDSHVVGIFELKAQAFDFCSEHSVALGAGRVCQLRRTCTRALSDARNGRKRSTGPKPRFLPRVSFSSSSRQLGGAIKHTESALFASGKRGIAASDPRTCACISPRPPLV